MEVSITTEGYQVTIHDQGNSVIDLTAICQLTDETFRVEGHTLSKIKPITIGVALKK